VAVALKKRSPFFTTDGAATSRHFLGRLLVADIPFFLGVACPWIEVE
jgi:hypothetical protein